MAAPGFGTSPFILPNQFDSPGNTLQQGLAMQERRNERQFEMNWRLQRQKEEDDWKKLNLIQELTDVDKYQTGDAVADALGNQRASELLQKYTALASGLSPAELQGRISQDIQNTATGMKAMRDELNFSNQQLAALKQRFPSLDTKALDKYYREDVLNRRIENGDFKNPIHVNPTNMRLDDPDFLAAFVSGDKATRDEIVNPKLVEKGVQVGMGSPSSYTMMKGDIPFFRKRNFNPDTDVKGGFLKKGINPQMLMKSGREKIGNADIETLDEDAYDVFSENAKLEMTAEAARRVPGFYNLSKADRNKVTRALALDKIQGLDQSGFSFGSATKPPHISINTGGGGNDGMAGTAKGNLLDKIDLAYYGSPQQGRIDAADVKIIPADLQAVLKSSGIDISEAETVQLEIENGKIIAITPEGGKRIDRTAVENAQKKFNTEGQRQPQPDFEKTIPKVKQPTGGVEKPKVEDLRKKYNY